MRNSRELQETIKQINKRSYKAYKSIKGEYDFSDYTLCIDHVQGDPFAAPSRVRIRVPHTIAKFPENTYKSKSANIALRDFLTREFHKSIKKLPFKNYGSGKSGKIEIAIPTQEVLARTSAIVNPENIEIRFLVGLPAFGRSIAGKNAVEIIFENIPKLVRNSLIYQNIDSKSLYNHIHTAEDADFLRKKLKELNLVSFVADNSILPRKSGINPKPLDNDKVIPFESPEELRYEVDLPHRGKITGMGIPQGVTLIVGGGYHGKSTLLRAIELGIYNHRPGDGREFVVTDPSAVKIRAEDGRRIEKVNISPFIKNLPFNQNTEKFSSEEASGSTSQATNIIEAIETKSKLLLIDEDTSATNFMIRDHRMQELVSKDKEPITPFIDKIQLLYKDEGISTMLVLGGSGDYFDVADHVICMINYKPHEVTESAKELVKKYQTNRISEGGNSFGNINPRIPLKQSFDPRRGKKPVKIGSRSLKSIDFGRYRIDLGSIEQLVDRCQTKAVGQAIYYALKYMNQDATLEEVINKVMQDIENKTLDVIDPSVKGEYAIFSRYELAAAINRLRSLKVISKK